MNLPPNPVAHQWRTSGAKQSAPLLKSPIVKFTSGAARHCCFASGAAAAKLDEFLRLIGDPARPENWSSF